MNEPSNFIDGSFDGCLNNSYEYPPYMPHVDGDLLSYRTVCMSAIHHLGLHYNLHNIHGLAETISTTKALENVRQKRAFVISRATFPGLGHYSGTWTGDVSSTWDDMKYSIPDILSFNLFGIPLVGADICGFNYNTTVALCERWSQLGAFYPFSRNHNSDDNVVQDPFSMGKDVILSAKKALNARYTLLPYLYTLFWQASAAGGTVAQPVFFEFPEDIKTYTIYQQFMWGPALLICPVLFEKEITVNIYLPKGIWYDFYSMEQIESNGTLTTLPAPPDTIPLLLRGGYIIPIQDSALNTATSRRNKMKLIVLLNENNSAKGTLFWDDGDSVCNNDHLYNYIEFKSLNNTLKSQVINWNYTQQPLLETLTVVRLSIDVKTVSVNMKLVDKFSYDQVKKILKIYNLGLYLQHSFTVTWST